MQKYCLDSGIFIEAWNKYYSPIFCSDYWDILSELGKKDAIIVPSSVKEEIYKIDDKLKEWLEEHEFLIRDIDEKVQTSLKLIFDKDEKHKRLVDSIKGRSMADPWVIAHALAEKATVVTKENKEINMDTDRIKIPNVCDNMGIRCIDDFQFINEVQIRFKCSIQSE